MLKKSSYVSRSYFSGCFRHPIRFLQTSQASIEESSKMLQVEVTMKKKPFYIDLKFWRVALAGVGVFGAGLGFYVSREHDRKGERRIALYKAAKLALNVGDEFAKSVDVSNVMRLMQSKQTSVKTRMDDAGAKYGEYVVPVIRTNGEYYWDPPELVLALSSRKLQHKNSGNPWNKLVTSDNYDRRPSHHTDVRSNFQKTFTALAQYEQLLEMLETDDLKFEKDEVSVTVVGVLECLFGPKNKEYLHRMVFTFMKEQPECARVEKLCQRIWHERIFKEFSEADCERALDEWRERIKINVAK